MDKQRDEMMNTWSDFEQMLRSVRPPSSGIDRDALMFAAGRQSTVTSAERSRSNEILLWRVAASCMSVVAVVFAILWAYSPVTERPRSSETLSQLAHRNPREPEEDPADEITITEHGVQLSSISGTTAPGSQRDLTERVAERGLDGLPAVADSRQHVAEPVTFFAWQLRDRILSDGNTIVDLSTRQ